MRGSPQRSRAWKIGTSDALARLVAIASVLIGITSAAHAQTPPTPPTPPAPETTPTTVNSMVSSNAALANLGSSFLERLSNQSNGINRLQRTNPGGGGASESTETPRYRTWFEGYGNYTKNGAVGDFVGDTRKTWGGVAGIGARVAPGINIGLSVDQSRSAIDIPLALQSATIDLTQIGFNASVDSGPWTWASRGGARLRQHQFAPRHRVWLCDRRIQCPARRRAERGQLLLDHGPGPHRAQGGVRICPGADRVVAGDRRPRSGDRDGRHRAARRGS